MAVQTKVSFTCDECGRWHRRRKASQNYIKSVHQHNEDAVDAVRFSNDTACLRLACTSVNDLCRDYEIVPVAEYSAEHTLIGFDTFLILVTRIGFSFVWVWS